MNVICFHNPNEENGYLSNWYMSDFEIDSVKYTSMEQYMMYHKAVCFRDTVIAERILQTDDVAEIKQLGREVANYSEPIWNGIRQIVIYEGLLEKFRQNEDLRQMLKDTNNSILAECAVKDRVWGIGLSMTDPDRLNLEKWKGKNLLGFSLMLVRERM